MKRKLIFAFYALIFVCLESLNKTEMYLCNIHSRLFGRVVICISKQAGKLELATFGNVVCMSHSIPSWSTTLHGLEPKSTMSKIDRRRAMNRNQFFKKFELHTKTNDAKPMFFSEPKDKALCWQMIENNKQSTLSEPKFDKPINNLASY